MIKPKEKEVQQALANASFHKPSISSAGARPSPIPSYIVSMMYSQSEKCGLAGIQAQSCIGIPQRPHRRYPRENNGVN